MASISIRDLRVSYNKGRTFVLDGLNLDIRDGGFCVLLGPSGCGKSTVMHCIAGLIKPQGGTIHFGETQMSSIDLKSFVPPQERNIAMVFQEYALYPNMTVRKNMSFSLDTKKVPKEETAARVNAMAGMLGIEDLLDRYPRELSGGQRQRAALGRALVRDPQVFLLDEPLGNLDAKLRDQVRYELKKIQSQLGVTTVYVTHDQTEAMTMADHIVLLNQGRIMQQGTPDELYNHPNNLFVAGFIGSPQINAFDCIVREAPQGRPVLDAGDFSLAVPENLKAALADQVGKALVLGIRPSNFSPANQGEADVISGVVDSVEPLGDANLVYLSVGKRVVVVKLQGGSAVSGSTLALRPDPAKMHLFDRQTGDRLGQGANE